MSVYSNRFNEEVSDLIIDFHSSIKFDKKLYKYDILGSIAHAKGLNKAGIFSDEEVKIVEDELKKILKDIEEGLIVFDVKYEDIHMNIEKILTDRVGYLGKKLHTGRSRNDQVALDIKLYLRDELNEIKKLLLKLEKTIIKIAKNNLDSYMPSFTHLQKAQATTFAHYIMAYSEMFKRDILKIENTLELLLSSPLGSAALCGTTYPIDREYTGKLLGFKSVTLNSLDGVSDRDHLLDTVYVTSLIMMHLSRFCEELIIFSSNDYSYIEFSDRFSTGSSIMPQKKNPDAAELIRGKTGRVYGDLLSLFTVLKGLSLAYNKDMQEDKEAIFDAIDTTKGCLTVFIPMLDTIVVNRGKMVKACKSGYIEATDIADYLTLKGMEFREAYKVVGQIVKDCISEKQSFDEISLEKFKSYSALFNSDIFEILSLENQIERRVTIGSPKRENVVCHINNIEDFLKNIV